MPSDDVQRNREAALGDPMVKTSLTSEDGPNYGTIPMPMFASRPLTTSSKHPVDIPQNYVVWKTRFKTQVSSGFDFPSEALLWINDVEMVDSLVEF